MIQCSDFGSLWTPTLVNDAFCTASFYRKDLFGLSDLHTSTPSPATLASTVQLLPAEPLVWLSSPVPLALSLCVGSLCTLCPLPV